MRARQRVALCMDVSDYYEHGIARGVVRYAKERGSWQLFGYGWMFRPVESLRAWKGDGIISRVESVRDARALASLGLPVVDVAGAIVEAGFHQVNNDDYETGRLAGEHLLSCGFRSFAFCGVRAVGWSAQRKRGFADAVRSACATFLVFEQTLVWWEKPEITRDFRAWLRSLPSPCGMMACNDTAGLKVTKACREIGIAVPRDLAVIGVDNEDVLCELSSPSLSSIPCDCERIGYEAASALERILSGRRPRSPVLIPPKRPVVRLSSDTLSCGDPAVVQAVAFIRESVGRGINVYDVLARVPASRRSIEIRFRKELGRTIHDEIVRSRIDRACNLLSDTDMTIRSAAFASGFGTAERFYKVFRKQVAMTPLEYRRRRRL